MPNFSSILRGIQVITTKAEESAKEMSKQVSVAANQTYEAIAPTANNMAKNTSSFASQA